MSVIIIPQDLVPHETTLTGEIAIRFQSSPEEIPVSRDYISRIKLTTLLQAESRVACALGARPARISRGWMTSSRSSDVSFKGRIESPAFPPE